MLVFLYRQVLNRELDARIQAVRARKPERLPAVLTEDETVRLLKAMRGLFKLMAELLYGSGLRAMDCLRLRVKDIDFNMNQIVVRDGKGHKDRITVLPNRVKSALLEHLQYVKQMHDKDLSLGFGNVYLPHALARKYPNADRDWRWQYVFPSKTLSLDPRS